MDLGEGVGPRWRLQDLHEMAVVPVLCALLFNFWCIIRLTPRSARWTYDLAMTVTLG